MNHAIEPAEMTEHCLSSEVIFDGKLLHVRNDSVSIPGGGSATREYIRHRGAVAIVPLQDDGKVILERQYRYPIDRVTVEIPAGKLEGKDDDRLEAAKRELREETGLSARCWRFIGDYYPTPAYSDERISMYLATGLSKGEQELDFDEFLLVDAVPLEDAVQAVLDGRITDGKTQAALLKTALLVQTEEAAGREGL